jgi:hypothetical protein
MSQDIGGGLFSMSGGMWSGLQSRASKKGREVVIDFRDTTTAQHGTKAGPHTVKKGKKKGQVVNRRRNPRHKNSQKAGTILEAHNVNVVQPTFDENLAMADAVSNKIGLQMAAVMDADSVQQRVSTGARATLVRSLKRYWEV